MTTEKKQKLLAAFIIFIILLLMTALVVLIGIPLVRFASEPEKFRSWINSMGIFSPLIYIGMVFLQVVVAIIPGEPFELAGGYAFGAIGGTVFCLIGATLGSIAVFMLVKRFGIRIARLFFSQEKIESLGFLRTTPKRSLLFFIIFTIPGTPKDLLCYVAGLTDMKLWTWVLISSVGRLPSVVTSTMGGDALGEKSYLTAIIVFAITLAVTGIGLLIYRLICKHQEKHQKTE